VAKIKVDYLFITHLPAFYKVDLYNEIANKAKVYVIFIGKGSQIRHGDFTHADTNFDFTVLNDCEFEKRKLTQSLIALRKNLKNISAKKIVVGGWDLPEFWWVALTKRPRMWLALESSIYESSTQGISAVIKKCFLKRTQGVFVSGVPHHDLLNKLNYHGKIVKTGGVGFFRAATKKAQPLPFEGRFLYVGRLSAEKNLMLLLKAFKTCPQYRLTIIGQGPAFEKLKQQAPANVSFLGHIANDKLGQYYQDHNVFILPSLKEPWGLVVEEALYYGLPTLVSTHVGARIDLVEQYQAGLVFEPNNVEDLLAAIKQVEIDFAKLQQNVQHINFSQRNDEQVAAYLKVLG